MTHTVGPRTGNSNVPVKISRYSDVYVVQVSRMVVHVVKIVRDVLFREEILKKETSSST